MRNATRMPLSSPGGWGAFSSAKHHFSQVSVLGFFLTVLMFFALVPSDASAQCTSTQKPDVLMLLDQSGSINNDKVWDTAICNVVQAFQGRLRFGLMTFNNTTNLLVPIGDNNATQICNQLGTSKPSGPSDYNGALLAAEAYWKTFIAADPIKDRPRYTIIMSDKEHNGADPNPTIKRMFNPGVSVGGANYPIPTFAIGFGDAGKLPALDQYAISGGTQKAYYATSEQDLVKALTVIVDLTAQDVCNGKDDDCDGRVDNIKGSANPLTQACTNSCGAGTQTCTNGQWGACSATAATETCNNKDDDCDGKIDGMTRPCYTGPAGTNGQGLCKGGNQTCNAGAWGACTGEVKPVAEKCDNADNNCDGKIDETFTTLGQACTVGQGACLRSGRNVCKSDGSGVECSVSPGAPASEVCDGKDNDCDGQTDEGLNNCVRCSNGQTQTCYSGPAGTSTRGECKSGTQTCANNAWGSCQGQILPGQEICDGKDNDCDAQVDEGISRPCKTICESGVEVCNNGTWGKCTAREPFKEVCGNNIDDDCNGQIDDKSICDICGNPGTKQPCYTGPAGTSGKGICKNGEQTCGTDGKWGACTGQVVPGTETCDGKDNDCDGSIDENLKQACKTDCGSGEETCVAGKWVNCTAPQPTNEVCRNQKDDDCDGETDEGDCGCEPGKEEACYSGDAKTRGVGECKAGKRVCDKDGKWGACTGEVKPVKEVCDDKKDNDCDGKIDPEDLCKQECKPAGSTRECFGNCGPGKQTCLPNQTWGPCEGAPKPEIETCDGKDNDCDGQTDENLIRACKTKCGDGIDQCQGGKWTGCKGPQPGSEVCDGVDNDCDGKIDNGAQCPGGVQCVDGICPGLCRDGECLAGQVCKDGRCFPKTSCADVTCREDLVCRGGRCIDPCTVVQCPDGFVCWKGKCAPGDCYTLGCPTGKICVQGLCTEDKCANLQCGEGELCNDGNCTKTCATVTCEASQSCVEGKCVVDPCKAVTCDAGKVCYQGECVGDPCKDVTCPNGRTCILGECKDNPCETIKCPDGQSCKDGSCADLCKDVKCADGEACKDGNCVKNNCRNLGCEAGKVCVEDKCVDDPCKGKNCSDKAFCRDGNCVNSCAGVTCKAGERCRDGSCEPDLCAAKNCEAGQVCLEGNCIEDLCAKAQCEKGQICQKDTGQCVGDPCLAIKCNEGAKCKEGQCIGLCEDVNCPATMLCRDGACVQDNCYHSPCEDGKICKDAKCVENPCKDKKCGDNEFCRDGKCIKSCAGVTCKEKEYCEDGSCKSDPCADSNCTETQFCDGKGGCLPDPCKISEILCDRGRICDSASAKCVDDACAQINCPTGQSCLKGQCVGAQKPDPENGDLEKLVGDAGTNPDGGGRTPGSCACTSLDGSPISFLLLFLLLPFVWRRRRLTF